MALPVQNSWLWSTSSSGDGSASGYTQSDWSSIVKVVGSCHGHEGIGDYLNKYAATTEAETVIIDTGGALVDGKPHACTTAGSVACIAAVGGGNTRIDRIVLRANWAGGASPNTVKIVNIGGTDAATPSAPAACTTSETSFDCLLWQALVDTSGDITLTDERNYADITTASSLGANIVDSDSYVDGSIDLAHMSSNSVDSDQYVDGSVDPVHLAGRTRTFCVQSVSDPDYINGQPLPNGAATNIYGAFSVPDDFVSGMTVEIIAIPVLSGNMYSTFWAYYGADGEAKNEDTDSTGPTAIAVTANNRNVVQSLSLVSVATGDMVRLHVQRDATNAGDTSESTIECPGWLVTYTADS